ncbi:MAG: iron-siderophore transport system ATP-binding protein [Arthrobacter pascens]|nr:iron-siderophore transport system ATP-binding protein [Arthrobacter pascens]
MRQAQRDEGLRTENLSLGYDGPNIIHNLSLTVPNERITSIIGPNGCGKSTLLRGLGRLLAPRSGDVLLDGAATGVDFHDPRPGNRDSPP